jgi:hypothetical protein
MFIMTGIKIVVTWREEEKNGFSITAENKQLGPCTNIISELRCRHIPGIANNVRSHTPISFNNYLLIITTQRHDTTDMSIFFYKPLPFRQNNAIRTNNTLTPTPNATDPTIPTLLITRACSAALRFAFA